MRYRKDLHNGMIQRKLSEIILRESKDPRFKRVTVSRVDAATDMSSAKIYYSIFPPEQIEKLTQSLNNAAGFFSQRLGKALTTRNTPKLIFIYDAGFDYSVEMDQILLKNSSHED